MKNLIYVLLRLSNDISAVRRGRTSRRLGRRIAGRTFGRMMR